jgi:NAD(P)H-hydrate epimerase
MTPTTKVFNLENLAKLTLFRKNSHKGENGKVLIIGGSVLFHSASIWAAELVAHFADLVFYYSPALINGELLLKTKSYFKNGIVIKINDLESYIKEADTIIIGQGMRRRDSLAPVNYLDYRDKLELIENLSDEGQITYVLTNLLPLLYPHKRWIFDAGALQEIEVNNIPQSAILTPHDRELIGIFSRYFPKNVHSNKTVLLKKISKITGATWLFKSGGVDIVVRGGKLVYKIEGGNEGLTKGGSGDLLAALAGVLYVKNPPELSAAVASFVLKKTAETLYYKQGPFFTTTELLKQLPVEFWQMYKSFKNQE